MRISFFLTGLWIRFTVLGHLIRGHKIKWKADAGDICPGDIVCFSCNQVIWCRAIELSQKELARRVGKTN